MNYKAVYDKLIVEKIDESSEAKTSTGIILKSTSMVFHKGKIVSQGKGTHQNGVRLDMDVKEGDVILYNPNMASPLTDAFDNKLFIITEREIMAIEEKSNDIV